MTDFFGALARRAIHPPAILPRVAARFERDGGAPLDLQDVPALPALQPEATEPPPTPQASVAVAPAPADATPTPGQSNVARATRMEPPAPTQPAVVIGRPTAATPPSVPPAVVSPARARAKDDSPREPPRELRPTEPIARPTAPPTVIEHHRSEHVEHHEHRVEIEHRLVERLSVVERVTPAMPFAAPTVGASPGPPFSSAQPPSPRVEIHIGRIEVLPAATVPEPRREELPRPVPAQSLETYLERRSAGHPSSPRVPQ